MKKTILFLLTALLTGCASTISTQENCHGKIYKNNFTKIIIQTHETTTEKGTKTFNEVQYHCVFTAFYTHKAMFDNFGRWNDEWFLKHKKHPALVWNKVDLFGNGEKYKVVTYGLENDIGIYASFMVFDVKGNDMLSDESNKRDAFIEYFGQLIQANKADNSNFYKEYWSNIDR